MLGWLLGRKAQGGPARKSGSAAELGPIIAQAAQFLIEALRVQMEDMDGIEQGLPAAAKDPFSLGYIAGFTEAVATMRKIDSDEHGFVVHQAVFTDVFGPQEGSLLFAQFMKLQDQDNAEITMGMTMGGEDMYAWLNGDITAPRKWTDYVNKN